MERICYSGRFCGKEMAFSSYALRSEEISSSFTQHVSNVSRVGLQRTAHNLSGHLLVGLQHHVFPHGIVFEYFFFHVFKRLSYEQFHLRKIDDSIYPTSDKIDLS